jgi:uncharacterized membrane protein YkvI
MLVATILFSIASALSFELARLTASYDYRRFFHQLLGKGWFAYEIAYFVLGLLVLAVVGAASGELVAEHLGMQKLAGTLILMGLVGLLVFFGSTLIEKVLAGWSFLLYATYAVLVAAYLWQFGDDLSANLASWPVSAGWFGKGVAYFGYNIAVITIILFCVRHMHCRKDAIAAGLLAGPLVMTPALLFLLAMIASYPGILSAAVPADLLMQKLNLPWMEIAFYIVVFGTFVETGTAFIHAVNERLAAVLHEKGEAMPRWLRPAIALVALIVAAILATEFGLIDLIAKGYGALTWVFIAIFAIPLCTVGAWTIHKQREPSSSAADIPA